MSIEREILTYLSEYKNKRVIKYKGIRTGLFGLPDFKYYKYQTLANRCSELKNNEYIKEYNGTYIITGKGKQFLESKGQNFKKFTSEKTDKDPKDLLIIYDIPQNNTRTRNWFRRELRKFHFIMIQRSVWVGPFPLPNDFKKYIKEIKLDATIKTFRLSKGYSAS